MAKPNVVISPPEQFQVEDLKHLNERETGSANWSQMGAKKTSTGLWHAKAKTIDAGIQFPKILVITTRSGKGTYFQLAPGLLPSFTIFNVGTQKISTLINGTEIKLPIESLGDNFKMPILVVTHYNVFTTCNRGIPVQDAQGYPKLDADENIVFKPLTQGDFLTDIKWDFVIVDEAHRMKNRKGKWVKNIKKLKTNFWHVMTGTGFINKPDEIWSLLNLIDRKNYKNYWQFRADYCAEDWSDSGYRKVMGVKAERLDEFRALVRSFGPRRELREVMPHLKEPLSLRREVELSPIQRRMYKSIVDELEAIDKKGTILSVPTVLAALTRLRQVCVATPEVTEDYYDEKLERRVIKIKLVEPSSKLDAVMDALDELEDDQQVVVFSNFKDPLELLKVRLDKLKIPYIHLQESDNDSERYNKWAVEWPKKTARVFMSTVQLGGESINLTSAQHLIFLDRSWSPKDNNQAIGRLYRPGQTGQPVVINIEAIDTTDQYVEEVNLRKNGWFKDVFGRDPK